MTTNKYCLQSIDHARRFQPIAERYGIEPDYWRYPDGSLISNEALNGMIAYLESRQEAHIYVAYDQPTYREDKIKSVLSDNCFTNLFELRMSVNEIVWELIEDLLDRIKISQGEPKRKATAELILLLNKEGLLDGK